MSVAAALAHLLIVASPTGDVAQDPLTDVDRLRGERRFLEALERSAAIEDPATRHRARLNVLYFAGDLAEAFEEANAGLRHEPQDPWLLYYGARLAVDLRRPEAAGALSASLARTVPGADSLTEQQRAFYSAAAREFEVRSADLHAGDERRTAAILRARVVVLCGCLGALGLFLALRGIGPETLRQSRTDQPPS